MNITTTIDEYTDVTDANVVRKAHPASYEAQIAISVFIGILGTWSTFGNILTMLAIGMYKNMQKKSNFFIFSLAVSDLLSGLIASPLWLYRRTWGYEDWQWGDFLCKTFWFVDESTSYCTAMHIASFAIWRYIGIRWPHSHAKISKRRVKIWLLAIWAAALTFGGAIFCTFYRAEDRSTTGGDFARWPSCSIITTKEGVSRHHIYYSFSSGTFMYFPMAILLTTSCLIVRELSASSLTKSEARIQSEKRAILQLALISASFLLGYIPNNVYVMWTTRTAGVDYRLDYWVHLGAYFALRTSECINPVVYNVSSKRMRKASKRVLRYLWNCCRADADAIMSRDKKEKSRVTRSSDFGGSGIANSKPTIQAASCDFETTQTSSPKMTNPT